MSTIFLWVKKEGWRPFELKNKKALAERSIIIAESAQIGNAARIGDEARIGDAARIGYKAQIGDAARIGYKAQIGDEARIGNAAQIGDEEEIFNTIFVTGTRHPVMWWGGDKVKIGCHYRTISEWLAEYESIGEKENYSKEQIAEYKIYLDCLNLIISKK